MPAGAGRGGLGVKPGAKAEAEFRQGAAGSVAEAGATGIVSVGLDRPGSQAGEGEDGGADGVVVLSGGRRIDGEVFGELLAGAEGLEAKAG